MRERWDEAINKIDEKYIAEAAQAHAKATEKRISEEEYELEGSRPKVMQMPTMAKKSRKPLIIGACAAAVGLAVLAGIHFGKGNDLLPQDTLTDEVTSETGETSETNEIVEVKEDGETLNVYATSASGGERLDDLIVFIPEDCALICLFGSISSDKIADILEMEMK